MPGGTSAGRPVSPRKISCSKITGNMSPLGRSLIMLGLAIAALGVLVSVAGKIPYLGRLPGDIYIKRGHFTFYFPLTTGILVSLILTILIRLMSRK